MAAAFIGNHGYTLRTMLWPEVISFYDKFEQIREKHEYPCFRPMLVLVEMIANSPCAFGLFPATSHATLRLVQTPEFYWDQERLEIGFDSAKRQFLFELKENLCRSAAPRRRHLAQTKPTPENWKRTYPAEEGFAALVRFIKAKKWFVEYGAAL